MEDGRTAYVHLLDEAMRMDKIGLISTNLAEKIAMTVTESPYRVTAESISGTCGQSISHGGAWNLAQKLGERISEEEEHCVKRMETGQAEGTEGVPVLFEEMDVEAQKAVTELFEANKMEEMLEYIRIYADSVDQGDETDKRSGNARKLYEYLSNNKEGLLPYQKAPKKDGKGNVYADIIYHHMPLLDGMMTASRKAFAAAFCS